MFSMKKIQHIIDYAVKDLGLDGEIMITPLNLINPKTRTIEERQGLARLGFSVETQKELQWYNGLRMPYEDKNLILIEKTLDAYVAAFVICHELRHIYQYQHGMLSQRNLQQYWYGKLIQRNVRYDQMPHENDADTYAVEVLSKYVKNAAVLQQKAVR